MRIFPALVLALLLSNANAVVIFSNLGPGDSFSGDGLVGNGNSAFDHFPHDIDIASSFRITGFASYTFDSVDIPLSTLGTNFVMLHLFSDDDNRPHEVIETIVLGDLPSDGTASPPIAHANSALRPVLTSGKTYWIGIDVSGFAVFRWNLNDQIPANLDVATRLDDGPWETSDNISPSQGAFRINGTLIPPAIPEPSTPLLLGVGLIALASIRSLIVAWTGRPRTARCAD